jgi:hypothetical protein
MNPIAYYIKTNQNLRKFIDSSFEDSIELITDDLLKKDLLEIQQEGTAVEKIQAISLLSAVKMFKL